MTILKMGSRICLIVVLLTGFGCGGDDDPAAPTGSNGETPDPARTPQFALAWGDSCWLGDGRGCVDPDGPGPLELGDGQFGAVTGVAVDAGGNVYAMDVLNVRLQKFDNNGNFITKWGPFGFLSNVEVDGGGDVLVVDGVNHRIQKFTSTGTFLSQWGSECDLSDPVGCVDPDGAGPLQSGDGQFFFPIGIAADASGNVYVADTGNDRIQKFDASGNFLLKWGSNGEGGGQFKNPQGIAVDGAGNVYVADWANHRVQKFNGSGSFLSEWGSNGTGDGQFDFPQDVTTDAAGYVYVTDGGNDRVQKFDATGNFLTKWGSTGTSDGQFDSPVGIAVDAAGNIYVADENNHRVQKFK